MTIHALPANATYSIVYKIFIKYVDCDSTGNYIFAFEVYNDSSNNPCIKTTGESVDVAPVDTTFAAWQNGAISYDCDTRIIPRPFNIMINNQSDATTKGLLLTSRSAYGYKDYMMNISVKKYIKQA